MCCCIVAMMGSEFTAIFGADLVLQTGKIPKAPFSTFRSSLSAPASRKKPTYEYCSWLESCKSKNYSYKRKGRESWYSIIYPFVPVDHKCAVYLCALMYPSIPSFDLQTSQNSAELNSVDYFPDQSEQEKCLFQVRRCP